MSKTRVVCFVLLASLVAAPMVFGQGADRGGIQGICTDKSGAVVPGVTITVRSQATNVETVMVSAGAGDYRFPNLLPGNYYLRAELTGFTPYEVKTVVVNVGRVTDVNIVLEPKGTAETITVNEVTPLVETTKTDIGGVIDNREAASAPLNGRNFSDLATLLPGTAPTASWDPTKTRIGAVSIAGAGGRNVNTTVDGVDNKDNSVGGWVQNVPLEGIKEFALKTQRFSAADGRTQGGLLSIVTKSGSNNFHGTWFTLFRQRSLNANDYWDDFHGATKPPFYRWQYGGSFGGPVKKDKLFFFFTYEYLTEHTPTVISPNIKSELQALVTAGVKIYGTQPGPVDTLPQPFLQKLWTARADWVINSKNNFYVSWNNSWNNTLNDQGPTDLTSTNFNSNRNYIGSAVLTSTLSAKLVNQFVFGGSYWNNLIDTNQYTPITVIFPSTGYGTNGNVPQQTYQKKWQFKDSMSWNKGSHSLRFGVDWVFEPTLGGFFGYTPVPAITFFDDPTTILSDKKNYPQGFSTPGIVSNIAETNNLAYSHFDFPNYVNFVGWYFQDDWRVSRKLSLNLGIRYDVDLGLVGAGGILDTDRTIVAARKINDPLTNGLKTKLPSDDKNNFGPRVGFAFDPTGTGKTVIRGGYGIYFDQLFNNINLFAIQQSGPVIFGTVVNKTNSSIGSGEIPNFVVNRDPLPPVPTTPLTDFLAGGGAVGRPIDPNYVSPMAQEFNVGFSREFLKNYVFEADYTHVLNTHEPRRVRMNYGINKVRRLTPAFQAAGIDPATWAEWYDEASVNVARYDALNLVLRKRLSNRFTMQGSYTLAKSQAYGGNTGTFGIYAIDQTNYLAPYDMVPTVQDERHRIVWSGVIDLPLGFQVSPIIQFATARPYTVTAGTDLNLDLYNFDLPVPGKTGAHGYVAPGPQNGAPSTMSGMRNGMRGGYDLSGNSVSGDFFMANLRIQKFINLSRVKEGMNISLSFEAFNLTNYTNFGRNFQGNIGQKTFLTTLGNALGTYGLNASQPFQGQFGLRFAF